MLLITFIFVIIAKTTPINAKDIEIKVGLAIRAREAIFLSDAPMTVVEGSKILLKERKLWVTCANGMAKINDVPFKREISITPAGGAFIHYNGKPYRGRFGIILKEGGLTIINLLSIEEYLYGVLGAEISPSWPFEALKAQAVVSRTYALNNMGRHGSKGFDFCTENHCQGYRGVSCEDPILNKAVDATRGEVLTYNGVIAKVFYHSDSGGYTASARSVWGEDIPYLKGVREDFYHENGSPYKRWRLEIPATKLAELLSDAGYDVGIPKDIKVSKRDEFNFRAISVKITGTKDSIEIPASRFRQILGYNMLRSTAFEVSSKGSTIRSEPVRETTKNEEEYKPKKRRYVNVRELLERGLSYDEIILILAEAYGIIERDVTPRDERPREIIRIPSEKDDLIFVFEGRGWGHGVGMNQWGARTLAERGKSYIEIIKFYFPGISIKKL